MKKLLLLVTALLAGVISSSAAVVENEVPISFTPNGPTLTSNESVQLTFEAQYNFYRLTQPIFSRETYPRFRIEYEDLSGTIQLKIQSSTQAHADPNWHGQYIALNAEATSYSGTFTVSDDKLDDDPNIEVFNLVADGPAAITVKKVVLIKSDNTEVELTDGTDGWNSHPSFYKGNFSITGKWQGFAFPVPDTYNERDNITYDFTFGAALPCAFNIEATYDDVVHYIEIPAGVTEYSYSINRHLTKFEIKDKTEGGYPHAVNISSIKRTILSTTVLKAQTVYDTEKNFPDWAASLVLDANINAKVGDIIRINFKESITNQTIKFANTSDSWNDIVGYTKNGSLTGNSVEFVLNETFVGLCHNGHVAIQGKEFTISSIQLLTTDNSVIPVTISEYEWATFVSSEALDFTGSDVKAYIVLGRQGTALTKNQITGTVPANTPLLLNAAEGNYNIPVVASSTTDVSANLLKAGTDAAISAESGKTKYVLGVPAGKAEFQKINTTAATVPTGKAYLEFSETVEARSLDIDEGGTTAIKNMKVGTEDNIYYDLQGRRVLYPTKGLYIVNGKKVIIK
jgi:hypothetical protein